MDIFGIKEGILDNLLHQYRTDFSYSLLKRTQDVRVGFSVFEFTKHNMEMRDVVSHKHKYYYKNFNRFIISDIVLILQEERDRVRKLKEYKYKLISLVRFNDLFNLTFDVFSDGIKVPRHNIDIVYTDFEIIWCMPEEYCNFDKLHLVKRSYTFELSNLMMPRGITFTQNIMKFDALHYPNLLNPNTFPIVYIDGRSTNNFTITTNDSDRNLELIINEDISKRLVEVVFLENMLRKMTVPKDTKYIRVGTVGNKQLGTRFKFPISKDLVYAFDSEGKYMDTELRFRSTDIFEIQNELTNDHTMLFYYLEYNSDRNNYEDTMNWYDIRFDLLKTLKEEKNIPYQVAFEPSKIDMNLNRYVKEKFKSNLSYADTLYREIILHDYRFYNKYIDEYFDFYEQEYKEFDFENDLTYDIDFRDFDLDELTRYNNRGEIGDPVKWTDLILPHIVMVFRNRNHSKFNIFLDGTLFFDYLAWQQGDDTYIYIRKNKVRKDSFMQVDLIKYNDNIYFEDIVISEDTNIIKIRGINFVNSYNFLNLFQKDSDGIFTELTDIIDRVHFDPIKIEITLMLKNIIREDSIIRVVNEYVYRRHIYNVRENMSGLEINLPDNFNFLSADKKYFEVYRNGRLFPDTHYDMKFPTKGDDVDNIKIIFNKDLEFALLEQIIVNFTPLAKETLYHENLVEPYGRIRLPRHLIKFPFNRRIMDFYLNGQKLSAVQTEIWTNNGLVLRRVNSRRNFNIVVNLERASYIEDFSDTYDTDDDLFDDFIKSIMVGELLDNGSGNGDCDGNCGGSCCSDNGCDGSCEGNCCYDDGTDILTPDIERKSEMFYALYKEYLQHNNLNIEDSSPGYIAIKYGSLANRDGLIVIDCDEELLKWMPLDPEIEHDESKLVEFFDEYYQILEDMDKLVVMNRYEIPDDIYKQYQWLFDNNMLVLHSPDLPKQ